MSLDGRLTRPPGEGMWLSGKASRQEVQRLRAAVDGILTSGETVRRDEPRLDVRDPELLKGREQPWRIVFSRGESQWPRHAPLFVDDHRERTKVWNGSDLPKMLKEVVPELGVNTLLLESGGELAGVFLDHGLIDEVVVFMAPMVCGGDVPALAGRGLPEGVAMVDTQFERLGDDVMLRGMIDYCSLAQSMP